ncbi:FAD-binding oxidoreductase [Lentzea nigeriaca]|uniref:FAD-binding oxidoreductase n=1 Tax=Lentzea nigeriaca TaxID=1128665 RepID=UPI00195797A4|nr:FAD-binding oxidoreductase [Lentzea nigeriaca]MBM7856377.1 FAD/FMN-containing dehydrogenase [Lentzea nigeriaca]
MSQETAAALQTAGFAGPVYLPGQEGYDAARLPWRRNLDPKPLVVAEATNAHDVQIAVRVARELGLPFGVQSTGHGAVVPADDGVLLKTSRMADVRVDQEQRTVTAGPGVIWNSVIEAVDPLGLAPLSGAMPWVGLAGYTLGGGTGWLSRKFGFAADSLLRATVVTADGELRTASENENPDLFWALRGGSGNFGVVTELELRLFPVEQVYAGLLYFPIAKATDVLTRYREWALEEPDELNTGLVMLKMPDIDQIPPPVRGKKVISLRACYIGDPDDGDKLLAPLREAGGEPLMGGLQTMTYGGVRRLTGPQPMPRASLEHVDLFRALDDEVIETIVGAASGDTPLSVAEIRHWGGAMARDTGTPVGHRDVPFSIVAEIDLSDGTPPDEAKSFLDGLGNSLRPHATGGTFLNFINDPALTETAFSPANWQRLREVKKTYDPSNFFHCNHNIPPAS